MSVARYSRDVRLDDLNNVHSFALLSVPPGSRVLDLGAAEGTISRALAARGCDVTAVETDAEGVALLVAHGVRAVHADLESMPVEALPAASFDVVLLLDVLEHLVRPDVLLAKLATWLAPAGRVLLSVPNVAHAAVRLALLQGRFPRTDVGLLDRTHLQFFDRAQLDALVTAAGLTMRSVLTVERDIHETEIELDLDGVPADLLAAATADPLSRVYQFFVIATPGSDHAGEGELSQALQARQRAIEHSYRRLETYASHVDAELLLVREARDEQVAENTRLADEREGLAAQLQAVTLAYRQLEAHARHLTAELAAAHEGRDRLLADTLADRDVLRQQLRERMAELHATADLQAVLQREIAVQRDFAAELAAQAPRLAALGGEATVLDQLERFRAIHATPHEAGAAAAEAAAYRRLQQALAIRLLARIDAALRQAPTVRAALRRLARALARRRD